MNSHGKVLNNLHIATIRILDVSLIFTLLSFHLFKSTLSIAQTSIAQHRKLLMAKTIQVFTAQVPNILGSLNISNISMADHFLGSMVNYSVHQYFIFSETKTLLGVGDFEYI